MSCCKGLDKKYTFKSKQVQDFFVKKSKTTFRGKLTFFLLICMITPLIPFLGFWFIFLKKTKDEKLQDTNESE
jgi:hypothetical protein